MSDSEAIVMLLMIAGAGIVFRSLVTVVRNNPSTAARAGTALWKHFNK